MLGLPLVVGRHGKCYPGSGASGLGEIHDLRAREPRRVGRRDADHVPRRAGARPDELVPEQLPLHQDARDGGTGNGATPPGSKPVAASTSSRFATRA